MCSLMVLYERSLHATFSGYMLPPNTVYHFRKAIYGLRQGRFAKFSHTISKLDFSFSPYNYYTLNIIIWLRSVLKDTGVLISTILLIYCYNKNVKIDCHFIRHHLSFTNFFNFSLSLLMASLLIFLPSHLLSFALLHASL